MKCKLILPIIIAMPLSSIAEETNIVFEQENNWGVGIGIRSATMPYKTNGNTVNDSIPLLFYQGDQLYLDGASGGYKLYQNDKFSAGMAAQLRFFDLPRFAQNTIQGSQIDFGGKATWHYSPEIDFSFEVLSDNDGRIYSNASSDYKVEGEGWNATFYASLRAKSARFNDTYYGLQMESIGSGVDSKFGVKGRTQLYRNLYAVGNVGATIFDHNTYSSHAIDSHTQWEGYLGLAMFGSASDSTSRQLPEGAYLRLANGIATESGPTDIIMLQNDTDPERNTLSSVFYGHPLEGSFFDLPIDFYLTPGYVYHHSSDVQGSFDEYVLAIKGYYTLDWSVRTRLGFAEGISYSTKISHIENKNLTENGYEPSKLMNYLDFSVDVNMGDVLKQSSLENLWLGYSLHHRSGIFTSTSAFGRIKGGSDYNSLYLQWHF
ncbi:MipA/OmpV family protein [Vibrio europaeus]|uniref:MipA/OmpV family protein n=1 Tax=Vibrio europaeus TaxID=300876 RepID=UPI00233EDE95|nr:MipA/OmpV family protein [Vibrio europaeus]MDC5721783.1 MipA/OmpV family protein [Vibrio europaeus]MDC5758173.1 MipA/OmpV family protein [Vibrio europaeus]MDC5776450.1 MipA/OmpV family protein [Vibrio europaeus]MDC5795691.1 MipA/OmpV family protein [Vibrio europaeus]MDC5801634.1 MipA/OmpV family protein [Vibrio europaeus]